MFRDWNIESFLPQIKCPVLVIQGENDEFGTIAQVDGIINAIPTASKIIIPDIGHNPHKEVPDVIIKKVRQFIILHLSDKSS